MAINVNLFCISSRKVKKIESKIISAHNTHKRVIKMSSTRIVLINIHPGQRVVVNNKFKQISNKKKYNQSVIIKIMLYEIQLYMSIKKKLNCIEINV